jgi:hypothetical protein
LFTGQPPSWQSEIQRSPVRGLMSRPAIVRPVEAMIEEAPVLMFIL